ncbi:MAG: hypothetical protein C5B43_02455 [Verrucomicrobia bacterium]|nr:MAG: hypothetical protein C5B43_02455 [Verrucomicrobiota bacterium]
MLILFIAIIITLSVSALCSLLEAMILSTTASEVEALKKENLRKGLLLEQFKTDIQETSSAILALNTIANTLGATVVGGFAIKIFGEDTLFYFSLGMTFGILLFSEILPKNIGILYRNELITYFIYPLYIVRFIMRPVSIIGQKTIELLIHPIKPAQENDDTEIILLAEKRAQEGVLTENERKMISNALTLDDTTVNKLKTPRQVVTAIDGNFTLKEVFQKFPSIPFSRLPVYENNFDNIIGIVRRRDMMNTQDNLKVKDIMHPVIFIPDAATAAVALQNFLKNHQQLAVTVDEFGSTSGVITMEDIFEHILGQQIFEEGDLAINMRDLAMLKKNLAEQNSSEQQTSTSKKPLP